MFAVSAREYLKTNTHCMPNERAVLLLQLLLQQLLQRFREGWRSSGGLQTNV